MASCPTAKSLRNNKPRTNGIDFVRFETTLPNLGRALEGMGFSCSTCSQGELYRQGDTAIVVSEGGQLSSRESGHVSALGIGVDNPIAIHEDLIAAGARDAGWFPDPVSEARLPAIDGVGRSVICFKHREPRENNEQLSAFDHVTHNVRAGESKRWAALLQNVLGFRVVFDNELVGTQSKSRSIALLSPCNRICLAYNESSDENSPVLKQIAQDGAEGVQHLAFATKDIVSFVSSATARGVSFIKPRNDAYYSALGQRLPKYKDKLPTWQQLGLIVDAGAPSEDWMLLQHYTPGLVGPIFLEFIERVNLEYGFGPGANAQTLYKEVEASVHQA